MILGGAILFVVIAVFAAILLFNASKVMLMYTGKKNWVAGIYIAPVLVIVSLALAIGFYISKTSQDPSNPGNETIETKAVDGPSATEPEASKATD